jgi:hypothetical protein
LTLEYLQDGVAVDTEDGRWVLDLGSRSIQRTEYLVETYLASGGVTIIVPIGSIRLSSVRHQGQRALSPFQQRFVDRQLPR